MNSTDKNVLKICTRLEERALAVLKDDTKFGEIPLQARSIVYKEMRRNVDVLRDKFTHLRSEIGHIKHEYAERGDVEDHKMHDRYLATRSGH